jgi:hypothetical protein
MLPTCLVKLIVSDLIFSHAGVWTISKSQGPHRSSYEVDPLAIGTWLKL